MNLAEKMTGSLLGAMAVGAQVGNTLVCVLILVLGPAVILWPLAG
jgi:hypothetical protein